MAPRAEEGRDKLRKATGKSKYLAIRRYPNEETQVRRKLTNQHISKVVCEKGTQGTETSKYLQEKKENSIPRVVASEIGRA